MRSKEKVQGSSFLLTLPVQQTEMSQMTRGPLRLESQFKVRDFIADDSNRLESMSVPFDQVAS